MKTSILGYGYVGQATHKALKHVDAIYDPNIAEFSDTMDAVANSDIAFICVPTPSTTDGQCDTSNIENALHNLTQHGFKGIACIRSTFPWWTKLSYQRVVVMPEFLNQNTFLMDSTNKYILGGDYNLTSVVGKLLLKHNYDPVYTTMQAALQTKYVSNLYGAFKTDFWEMVQDITHNQRLVYNLFSIVNGQQGDMATIGMDGYRGYGGACFPKDVSAIASKTNHEMLNALERYNKRLRHGKQK